jgi:putative methylase
MNKKQLSIILSKLKEIEAPKPDLEQYTIPGDLAAEILNLASLAGDINGKKILDLGCGSGRFSIGALILGAKKVVAVDIDPSVIETAKNNLKTAEELTGQKLSNKVEFIKSDISDVEIEADTVIQNPPYGIQKKHADRIFLEKALKFGKRIYSLHRSYFRSRDFIKKFVEQKKGNIEKVIKFKFRIPYMFRFHKKKAIEFDVDLFVIQKVK